MPDARCTRGLVRNGEWWMRARAYGLSGGIRHPLRNGFTAYAVLPGDEFVLSPSSADFATAQPGRV